MRSIAACAVCLGIASAAAGQPAPNTTRRISFHVAASTLTPTTRQATRALGLTLGADVPISARASIRIEGGRRVPSRHTWTTETEYYLAPPGSTPDAVRASKVIGTWTGTDSSLFDLAFLARYARPVGARMEIAALGSLELEFLETRSTLSIPRSVSGEGGTNVMSYPARARTPAVVDVGVECLFNLHARWGLAVFARVGIPPPTDEHRRNQVRVGAMVTLRK